MRVVIPVLTRILSALLALALIAAGVVLAIEVIAAWTAAGWVILPDDLARRASGWRWSDRQVVTTLLIIGATGLVTLAMAIWRRPALTVPVEGHRGVELERYALEKSIRSRLESVDGVSSAKVRIGHGKVTARVDTNRRYDTQTLKGTLETVLERFVGEHRLNLSRQIRLRANGATL